MKVIVQPDAGVAPVITAIKLAKKTIDIMIFRLDRLEITRALEAAVARGVSVRALIAHTNSGGEKTLRKLELRLLEQGVSVTRTADDLVRYHGKMIIIDHRTLHVYGFNFTGLDIERSRSFGLMTKNPDGTTNYDDQANQTHAKNLKGKLLIAHGTMDTNVPPNNTLLVVNELIRANKDFDLIMFPNRSHGFGNEPYMVRRRWDYFVRHLLGAEPPANYEMRPAPAPTITPM